jgi:NADH-quinone oxidoreductase subunit G
VLAALSRGEIGTLLVAGDPLDPSDTLALDAALRSKVSRLVYVGPFVSGVAESADVLLPAAAWSEADGTMVNFEGWVQRVRRCHLPRGEGRPGWRVALDLALAAGASLPAWASPDDVLRTIGTSVSPLAGLDAETLGLLGVGRG